MCTGEFGNRIITKGIKKRLYNYLEIIKLLKLRYGDQHLSDIQ